MTSNIHIDYRDGTYDDYEISGFDMSSTPHDYISLAIAMTSEAKKKRTVIVNLHNVKKMTINERTEPKESQEGGIGSFA